MNEQEIKKILQDYLNGTISPEDERRLELFEGKLILKNLNELNHSEKTKQKIKRSLARDIQKKKRNGRLISYSLKIAASLILLFVIGRAAYLQIQQPSLVEPVISWTEKTTPLGSKLTFALPDGTQVKLNSGSSLKFPENFTKNERRVLLEGEAFFDVVKNDTLPFIIESNEVETSVVGTSFNINAYEDHQEIIVSVLTGEVTVSAATGSVSLSPHEQGIYHKAKSRISKGKVDIEKVLYWKEGIQFFDDMPLQQVARALERWYGVEIMFKDQNLKHCHLTATYQNESLETILKSIMHTKKGLHYHFKNKKSISLSGICNE